MFITKATLHQALASSSVLFNEFIIGLGWGWVAPVLIKLQNGECDFELSEEETSWIASINEAGRLFTPLFSFFFVEKLGRQKTIIFITLALIASSAPLIFVRNVWTILALRLCFGLLNGISDVVASIYLGENLSPTCRGVVGGIVSVFFYAGLFIEFILGTYLSYTGLAVANTIISLCGIVGCFYVTETPYFSLRKGKTQTAEVNLRWLRGDVEEEVFGREIEKIKQNVQAEGTKRNSINVIYSSSENIKSVLIIFGIYFITTATGNASLEAYSSLIFVPSTIFTSNEFTILFGIAQFLAVCISPFIIERYNRRSLLILSFLVSAVCHALSGVLFSFHSQNYDIPYYPWLIFGSVTLYNAISAFIYPVLYILRGEIFPMSTKAIGGSVAILTQSGTCFALTKVFLVIDDYFGMQANFLLYFIMSIVTVFYAYLILPETRGKTLVDIQMSMKKDDHKKCKSERV